MKYGIYGINRITKDFLYIFNDLNVLYIFEDEDSLFEKFEDKPVMNAGDIPGCLSNGKIDRVIICDFDKKKRLAVMQQLGLQYGTDFLYESDFFIRFDTYKLNKNNKPLVAWGAGNGAGKLGTYYGLDNISFFIDMNKSGLKFPNTNIPIFHPEEIDLNTYFIIITVRESNEIICNLESKGLEHYKDFCTLGELLMQPSWMLRKTVFDTNCYDVECRTFFNHAELSKNGIVLACCGPFVAGILGNVEHNTIDEIWKGIVHKIMCLSVNNRTYSFCDPSMCPVFIGRSSKGNFDFGRQYLQMQEKPTNFLVNFEDSCNLYCESCRNHVKIASGKELEKNLHYADIVVDSVLPHLDFIIMAGTGEVFVGKGYERLYTSNAMSNIKWIRLLTNGMLFNEKNWKKISRGKTGKFILTVSIDAATKDTYEELRRGGNFDILKRNMEFAAKLRKEGKLSYFRLNFVVQRKNYKEMPLFVQWGRDLGVDEVFFTKILNFGTYTQEEFFSDVSMMEADGMTAKPELQSIIDLPIMEDPIVNLGTIRYHEKPIGRDELENYYRYELERRVPNLFASWR